MGNATTRRWRSVCVGIPQGNAMLEPFVRRGAFGIDLIFDGDTCDPGACELAHAAHDGMLAYFLSLHTNLPARVAGLSPLAGPQCQTSGAK